MTKEIQRKLTSMLTAVQTSIEDSLKYAENDMVSAFWIEDYPRQIEALLNEIEKDSQNG